MQPIVRRSMNKAWLSNSYLVADRPGGRAVVIDTGAPTEPITSAIDEMKLTLTHVLCTHYHRDHVAYNEIYKGRFGCPVCAHSGEAEWLHDLDRTLSDGEEIRTGALGIRAEPHPECRGGHGLPHQLRRSRGLCVDGSGAETSVAACSTTSARRGTGLWRSRLQPLR